MADYGYQTLIKIHLNVQKSFHFIYIFGFTFVVFDAQNENSSKLPKHPKKMVMLDSFSVENSSIWKRMWGVANDYA